MKMKIITTLGLLSAALLFSSCASGPGGTKAMQTYASASKIRSDAEVALQLLYSQNDKARELGAKAKGVLVFPNILKGGFVGGVAGGDGALFQNGQAVSYYNTVAASWGFQAGIQKYGYALIMMDDSELAALNQSGGWNVGTAPSIVVVDKGKSGSLTTSNIRKGTYAFFFDQRGLMGGTGIEGSKITRIVPKNP